MTCRARAVSFVLCCLSWSFLFISLSRDSVVLARINDGKEREGTERRTVDRGASVCLAKAYHSSLSKATVVPSPMKCAFKIAGFTRKII